MVHVYFVDEAFDIIVQCQQGKKTLFTNINLEEMELLGNKPKIH